MSDTPIKHNTGGESQRIVQFQLQGNAAERYERWVVPFVSHPMALPLLDLADLQPGERVLDLATGTGMLARLAARRVTPGGAVTGLDLNDEMLKAARELPLPPGLKIEWRQGSAQDLPFDDGAFDVVVCQQGFQFFPDRIAALHQMRRVLRARGRVALSVFTGPSLYFMAVRDAVARHVSAEAARSTAAGFSLGDAEEFGDLLKDAGFHNVLVHHVPLTPRLPAPDEFVLQHLSAMPLAESVAGAGNEARAALITDMEEAMSAYIDGYGLAVPQEIHVATGHV
jgi:ubiquinone/menaquinone biosynthesis C-methylase UbiE